MCLFTRDIDPYLISSGGRTLKIEVEKIIQIIENVGWYHPSNANWSYRTHIIVDDTGARLYKETFGGDSRIRHKLEEEGYIVKRLYLGKGSGVEVKYKDIKELLDIEDYSGKNY